MQIDRLKCADHAPRLPQAHTEPTNPSRKCSYDQVRTAYRGTARQMFQPAQGMAECGGRGAAAMPGEDRGLGAGSGPSESRAVPEHPPLPEHPSRPSADDECVDDDDRSARRVRSIAEAVFIIQDARRERRGPLAYHSRTRRPGRRTGGGGLPLIATRRALETLPDSLVRGDLRRWASTGVAKGFNRSQLKLLIRAKETQLARRELADARRARCRRTRPRRPVRRTPAPTRRSQRRAARLRTPRRAPPLRAATARSALVRTPRADSEPARRHAPRRQQQRRLLPPRAGCA